MSAVREREERVAVFSRGVRQKIGEVIGILNYGRIEERCRTLAPADFKQCLKQRLRTRGQLLQEMEAYFRGTQQEGCYAECDVFRHEIFKKPQCILDCQARLYSEGERRLNEFVSRARAVIE